jgi:hypothetical protein
LAWGCTPQAAITLQPAAAVAGGQVAVSGSSFVDGPVEIRWGSASGAVIATGHGPSFTATATIPRAAPGTYYVVAVARDGDEVWTASQAFEVRAGQAPPTRAPVGDGGGERRGTAAPGSTAAKDRDTTGGRVRSAPSDRGAGRGARSGEATATGSGSGRAVFRDSVTRSSNRGTGGERRERRAGGDAARPSRRTAVAALWGGFARERSGSPAPNLIAADASSSGGPGGTAAVVVVLGGLGMTALLGGLMVAGRRARTAGTRGSRGLGGGRV